MAESADSNKSLLERSSSSTSSVNTSNLSNPTNTNSNTTNDETMDFQTVNYQKRRLSPNSRDPRKNNAKKTLPTKTGESLIPIAVEVSNKFNCLPQDVSSSAVEDTTEKRPPPIYLSNLTNYSALLNDLKLISENLDFKCKSNVNSVIVYPSSSEQYRKFVIYFKTNQMSFHTYQLPDERSARVVLRGLHHSTPVDLIKDELINLGFQVKSVCNIISRSKLPLPLFFVDFVPQSKFNEIYKLDKLLHTVIKVEDVRKPHNIVQCTNCQSFNHTKAYCFHPSRCVKCAGSHHSSVCSKSRDKEPKCVLCQQPHTANYKGCNAYQEAQRLRRRPNFSQIRNEQISGSTPPASQQRSKMYPISTQLHSEQNNPQHSSTLKKGENNGLHSSNQFSTYSVNNNDDGINAERNSGLDKTNVNMYNRNLYKSVNSNHASSPSPSSPSPPPHNHSTIHSFNRLHPHQSYSYSSALTGQHDRTQTDNINNTLSSFLSEMKQLIFPLISLLTQLTNAFIANNAP